MKKFISAILLVLTLSASSFVLASDDDRMKIFTDYIAAYSAFDVEKMSSYYASDSKFTDPTSEVFGEHAYHMNGKEEIVKRLTGFVNSVGNIKLNFKVKNQYSSADYFIFHAGVKIVSGANENFSTACGDITTILTIKDGKVLEHRDYFDYESYRSTFKKSDQNCAA